jgi:hypothetical protein
VLPCMAVGVYDRISGRKVLGGGSGVGEVGGGGGHRKLVVCGGRIEGHGSRIGREVRLLCAATESNAVASASNSQGDLFGPDSEDEDAMEVMPSKGAPSMEVAAERAPSCPRRCRRAWRWYLLASIQCTMRSSSVCTRLWCPLSSNATSSFVVC